MADAVARVVQTGRTLRRLGSRPPSPCSAPSGTSQDVIDHFTRPIRGRLRKVGAARRTRPGTGCREQTTSAVQGQHSPLLGTPRQNAAETGPTVRDEVRSPRRCFGSVDQQCGSVTRHRPALNFEPYIKKLCGGERAQSLGDLSGPRALLSIAVLVREYPQHSRAPSALLNAAAGPLAAHSRRLDLGG